MVSINQQNYRLSRHYALISLIAITITAIVIFIFFRGQTIQTIETASERSYTALALTMSSSMNDYFIEYFKNIQSQNHNSSSLQAINARLENRMQRLIADKTISRIKIYDPTGKVVYSSKRFQIGKLQNNNPGFLSAINGIPKTKFIYHDVLNVFSAVSQDVNLVQSYVPIRGDKLGPPIGVFEIYADVNEQIVASIKTQLVVLLFVLLTMFGLYITLMFYIKKAEKVIDEKQRESNERQKNLEILSAKMITAQEDEKKRISSELHEDVVQTITAVKLQLEQCVSSAEQNHSNVPVEVPFHIIPILQESISKIRSLSINLRPPSLDDFGLKAATNTLVSEFNSMPSKLKIRVSIDVNEEALGEDKKSILYRILKDTLKMISIHRNTEGEIQVRLSINHQSGNLKLAINFENNESKYMDLVSNDLCDTPDFEMMRESTILSGGSFKVFKDTAGSIKASSEWEVV